MGDWTLHPIEENFFFLLSDDSGCWGRGGLFTALEKRSAEPRKIYELAGKMKGEERSREKGHGWTGGIVGSKGRA